MMEDHQIRRQRELIANDRERLRGDVDDAQQARPMHTTPHHSDFAGSRAERRAQAAEARRQRKTA